MEVAFVHTQHALTKIIVGVAICTRIYALQFGNAPLGVAISRPGTQHVPTAEEHNVSSYASVKLAFSGKA
ncbi:hypothetical protein ANCCAN_09269 [Ancylostoma caninum]|uniref:Uncharacterized protein n=1 Tax=Ancylostoma caninum TaxID=29170 RepID=A0A368GK75_ANCCA|nr:hypothetical protein ANCCAN_09269 [Ancylostoma caninum]